MTRCSMFPVHKYRTISIHLTENTEFERNTNNHLSYSMPKYSMDQAYVLDEKPDQDPSLIS